MINKLIVLIIMLACTLLSQDIDWVNKTITVEGTAYGKNKLMAKRGAKTDARRNLIEALKEIRVDSKTTMRDLEVEEDLVVTQASGYIKQAWFDDNSLKYERDGEKWMCVITVTMPLLGEYSQVVLPSAGSKRMSAAKEAPKYEPVTTPSPPAKPYTGLVVDLRGKKVVPTMVPRIVSEDGTAIYDMSRVSRQYATEMGVVGYIKKVKSPQSMIRIGDNPLVVKAEDITGATPTDAVMSNDTARLISSLEKQILTECRVAFLID